MSVNLEALRDILRRTLALCWAITDRPEECATDMLEAATELEPLASGLLDVIDGSVGGGRPSSN